MDNKGKDRIIILMGALIVILVVLCVLFVTNVIQFKTGNNESVCENIIDETEKNETGDEILTNQNDNIEVADKSFYDINDLTVKALDEYRIFSDISSYSNYIEEIVINNNYQAKLKLNGDVEIVSYTNGTYYKDILDVHQVIDIVHFDIAGPEAEQLLYVLTLDGDVYYYRIGNSDNRTYNATKVEQVSKVKQLFVSHYFKENAGSSWALFAITENRECIMLMGSSV